ncbi:MAG: hypothetical protein PUI40_04215 [Oscillospiraceae bacterium]|nr:hypothetical protein [Oscillospiraceae bacterium]MDD7041150.1 hypothetical protein [Oscillospiraceae bacterium]MDY2611152.1 hypothetical protein [Oscillospiraceae bacterium]
MKDYYFVVHDELLVVDENDTKVVLGQEKNSEKIYILREFECELLQMIRHTKDYEHLLESVKNKYQGDTIQEDLNEFLISLAEAGIIEMIKNK